MPKTFTHDHSPPAGERDSPGRNPRDGGGASHGLTAVEHSSAVPGTSARFGRRTPLHADSDLSVCRGNPGWPLHDTRLLNVAQQTSPHSKEA